MFNSRFVTTVRAVAVAVYLGAAAVPLVSGCHSTTASAPSSAVTSVAASAGVYGDPGAAAKYWRAQSLEDNCGLMSVADVVGELTGNEPTEQQMITLAQNTPSGTNPGPIYASSADPSHANGNGGVEMADLVVLLDHYGIKSAMYWTQHPETTGMPALQRYLRDGRKAIAWVNSAVIWNTYDQRTKADHYLVVTGIDTDKQVVHLNDPGADHPDEQVNIGTFTKAWQPGEESIVVTARSG
ncbi:C39 family peptidase [Mycobacterium sp. 050128]|uniref:C39 family peptidase n=1 Tax=Mycobacterium sp. 050128 TaxID=3096112 RepID=UPI002ED810D0